jgi:pimeloyl-ACP methyl ester carboxylesterase
MNTAFAWSRALALVLLGLFAGAAAGGAEAQEIVRIIRESKNTCRAPCDRTAVVFIHGLLGSRETWANDENITWPEMLATDPDVGPMLDVYRVDYDSFLLKKSPGIVDVFKSLQPQLDAIFAQAQYSKIVLIGHSLGGNVARGYLLHVKAHFGHRVLSFFPLTITLATPRLGSDLARIARVASPNPQIRVLQPIKANDFGQLLNLTLDSVMYKHDSVLCPALINFAAYEEAPTPGVGIVVSEQSATYAAGNHSSLVKPHDRGDEVYTWVKKSLIDCISNTEICRSVPPECGQQPPGWPPLQYETILQLEPGLSTTDPEYVAP